jgi:hypothetical protein
LPAICSAGSDTLIIADGFSCCEQIQHGAGRYPLHPSEVLELALKNERITVAHEIENRLRQSPASIEPTTGAAALAAIAAAGALALWLGRRSARSRRPT